MGILFLILLLLFVFFCWMHTVPLTKSGGELLIILGYKSTENAIHPLLKERLDTGMELFLSQPFQYILLTGGPVGSERPEAELMAEYLQEKGIPKEKILLETKAMDTIENILFTKEIAEGLGCSACTIISNSFHLRRIRHLAKEFRFPVQLYCRRGLKALFSQFSLTFNEVRIYFGTKNKVKQAKNDIRKKCRKQSNFRD